MFSQPTSCDSIISLNIEICQICEKPGHGKHFGAFTCRACATFFRRYGGSKKLKTCVSGGNCDFIKNGYFCCKMCRLQKCFEVGMKSFKRKLHNILTDTRSPDDHIISKKRKILKSKIPPTMDIFLRRTNLIIFNAPNPDHPTGTKHFIDVRYLVQQAENILKSGSPTPIFKMSSLEKLALGLRECSQSSKTTTITKVGKDETLAFWQSDMIKVAKWFTYFDEFQLLPFQLRIQMIKGIWRVWSRLNRLATSMKARRQQICEDNMMMIDLKEESVVFHLSKTQIDVSWQSNYNVEQLKLFGYRYLDEKTEFLIQEIINLEPSDVELSYMLCQLCFYYVGKRFQGVLQEIADRLLEVLSNNLHDYYMKQMGCSKYSGRIAGMMRINNQIQKGIYERRAKAELMKIFDVFFVEYSDPEMFVDA